MAKASKRWPGFLAALFTLAGLTAETGWAQGAVHWSFFKTADGLSEPVYHAIAFTPQGRLVAADTNAPLAAELDGYAISNFPAPLGFSGRICESPGGQRWAMVPTGLLEFKDKFKDDSWRRYDVPEIAAAFRSGSRKSPPPFLPIRQGRVLFLLPSRLMEFLAEDPDHPQTVILRTATQAGIGPFTGMAVAPDGSLWISGAHGVARAAGPVRNLNPATAWETLVPPVTLGLEQFEGPEPDNRGGITFMVKSRLAGQMLPVTFDGRIWNAWPGGPANLQWAWRGPDGTLWAASGESLFQWDSSQTNWVKSDEVPVDQIFDVAVEPDGAFWLATSDGLIRGAAALWQKPAALRDDDSPVSCLTMDPAGAIYYIAGHQLHQFKGGWHREFPLPGGPQNPSEVRELFPVKDGSLLVDIPDGPLQFQPADGSFKRLPPDEGVPLGRLLDGDVCFYRTGQKFPLAEFDGRESQRLAGASASDVPTDGLTALFSAPGGDLWLANRYSVCWRHGGVWEEFGAAGFVPAGVVAFTATPDGKIWGATLNELWEFNGENWSLLPTRFNHINALMASRDGTIWLASNGGLFRHERGAWLDNGPEEGLSRSPVTALAEGQGGQIWAATARGVEVFHPEADPDPPRTWVNRLTGENGRLTEGGALNLLLQGRDKWKMTPAERLLYSYQFDQQGWSAFRDTTVLSFPNLAASRHSFQVRAMDAAGNVEPVPVALDFAVSVPWFREARLWVVGILGLVGAIFFAAVAWNRHRRLVCSYAVVEQKVAERTRELEIATRELMHSQKMNALGTLAAGIAHDFNNILSIIKGSAQIIEDNPGNPEKIRTRVDRIKTVVQQGAEIVEAMLGFSRGPDTAAAQCDVNAAVADTLKLLGDRFLREVEVKFERAGELPELGVPREFIQQILLNFIFNAVEAMSVGPRRIALTTRRADKLPPDIFLAPGPAAAYVLVSVADCGTGIAPEILHRIFEPFFTTKALSTRRGTGLGLSMAYELAKKMQAGLAVQSVVGRGSTFTLILPAPADPPVKAGCENSTESMRS